jgi:hypothetical protein
MPGWAAQCACWRCCQRRAAAARRRRHVQQPASAETCDRAAAGSPQVPPRVAGGAGAQGRRGARGGVPAPRGCPGRGRAGAAALTSGRRAAAAAPRLAERLLPRATAGGWRPGPAAAAGGRGRPASCHASGPGCCVVAKKLQLWPAPGFGPTFGPACTGPTRRRRVKSPAQLAPAASKLPASPHAVLGCRCSHRARINATAAPPGPLDREFAASVLRIARRRSPRSPGRGAARKQGRRAPRLRGAGRSDPTGDRIGRHRTGRPRRRQLPARAAACPSAASSS